MLWFGIKLFLLSCALLVSLAFPKDGQVKTTFLAIRELPDGKADTITNKMVAVAEELQLDLLHKLSGMCKG